MTCLVIVDSTPIDTMSLDLYKEKAAPTLKPFNGEFIAKGEIEVLHGESPHPLKAVIQFPDKDSARNWYNSDAYQAIIPLRNKGMNSQFHLV